MAVLFKNPLLIGCVLTLSGSAPALANDSPAVLPGGGLQLVRNDSIRMLREDLDIGRDLIRVRYVFRNEGAADTTIRVAFPLPVLNGGDYANISINIPHRNQENFVGFKASADGKPLSLKLEEKATLQGREVTSEVRRLGFRLNPMHLVASQVNGAKIDHRKQKDAEKIGLVYEDGTPAWDYEATFHWEQTFPVGKDVTVEHSYKPVVGSMQEPVSDYCIDDSTARAIKRSWPHEDQLHFARNAVHYVLMTARNWSGPIGEFHLTLRKPDPRAIVSVCLTGLRKTSPTTFEWTKRNFVPDRDLKVLFVNAPGEMPR